MASLLLRLLIILASLFWLPFHSSAAMDAMDDPVQYARQFCGNTGNYTTNSTFQANLNLLLTSLSSNAPATGYYNDTKGRGLDQVYGLALCRGDLAAAQCRECLASAVLDVVALCPLQKAAILLYPRCLVRYSNKSFFGTPMGHLFSMHNVNDVSNLATFDKLLSGLVENLTARAAASPRRFAAGEEELTLFNRIYVMAQCTMDLSTGDCRVCLREEISGIPTCCAWKQGGVLVGGSCSLRYEVYPFYSDTADVSSPTAAAAPPTATGGSSVPTGAGDKKDVSVTLVVEVIIALIVAVAVISIILIRLQERRERTMSKDGGGEKVVSSSETLLFESTTQKAATDSFSDVNKLG